MSTYPSVWSLCDACSLEAAMHVLYVNNWVMSHACYEI
uniref:Uncharacterized protein n=1 Tax=Anguilla anguilla TaxID=7936 RepID=A0A0E9RI13_ANGAN